MSQQGQLTECLRVATYGQLDLWSPPVLGNGLSAQVYVMRTQRRSRPCKAKVTNLELQVLVDEDVRGLTMTGMHC